MLEHIEEIKRKYHYDPVSGNLIWKVRTNAFGGAKNPGDVAGSVYSNGRIMVTVNKKPELAHRVAWVLMTGQEPPPCIDHIDRNPTNNAWANLRAATMRQNQGNRSPTKGRALPTGVISQGAKFAAKMTQRGRTVHLGTFSTVEEAEAAYRAEHAKYFC